MSHLKMWTLFISAAIFIAVASSFLTYVALSWSPKPYTPPRPKSVLTEHLGGQTWAEGSKEFDHRVKGRFPSGISETAMTDELRRQGFKRYDWTYQKNNNEEAVAFRSESNIVCNQGAWVYWRTDTSGNITSVRGVYAEMGCL